MIREQMNKDFIMKIKKRLIETGILAAVFVAAVCLFGYLTNRDDQDMTADLGNAALPRISFACEGYEVNPLSGYVEEMDAATMRDTITPVSGERLEMNIQYIEDRIPSVSYAVYTIDGTQKLYDKWINVTAENLELDLDKSLLDGEKILRVTLHMEDRDVYYYTRIVDSAEFYMGQCLDYVNDFHEHALAKAEGVGVGAAIEPSDEGDNATFQHVTIHSDYDHVTWGDLEPSVVGTERWEIKEAKASYTSVLLEYDVRCRGEENEEDLYRVKEFFRVRMSAGRMYLLNYDRKMTQVFDGSRRVLSEKGVLLGIAPYDAPYLINGDGTIVSFIQANELWNYSRDTDELSLLFSFVDAENTDVRNLTDDHEIKLISIEENGNTTFAVYGYMNRGPHEGQVGAAVYYYNKEKNSIDEKVFIPSNKSAAVASEELGRLAYYSIKEETLYMLVDGTLYAANMADGTQKEIVTGLQEGRYVVSEDGRLVAYQSDGSLDSAAEIVIKDLSDGQEHTVDAGQGQCVRPLGFIQDDFVLGIAHTADIGSTVSGETVIPMYRVEIRDPSNAVIRNYESAENYVLDVKIEEGMLTLNRAVKDGASYARIESEYLANNQKKEERNIYLESYETELKETQMRLTFADGIQDKSAKILKPKLTLADRAVTLTFERAGLEDQYYVYGYGELQDICEKAGTAVAEADSVSGVVISSDQRYVWERGNRYLEYELEGKDDLIETLRAQLNAGGRPIEVVNQLSGNKGIDLTGCTAEEILYVINRGTPVVGMIDSENSVILIGYNESEVTYVETSTGSRSSVPYDEMDRMLSGSGRTFIGYLE